MSSDSAYSSASFSLGPPLDDDLTDRDHFTSTSDGQPSPDFECDSDEELAQSLGYWRQRLPRRRPRFTYRRYRVAPPSSPPVSEVSDGDHGWDVVDEAYANHVRDVMAEMGDDPLRGEIRPSAGLSFTGAVEVSDDPEDSDSEPDRLVFDWTAPPSGTSQPLEEYYFEGQRFTAAREVTRFMITNQALGTFETIAGYTRPLRNRVIVSYGIMRQQVDVAYRSRENAAQFLQDNWDDLLARYDRAWLESIYESLQATRAAPQATNEPNAPQESDEDEEY